MDLYWSQGGTARGGGRPVHRDEVGFAPVSTPTSIDLPDGVRRTTIRTERGRFAALEALPASGVCEREAALLVPGYTGSKEDFLATLDLLADGGRRVVAIDMRGQFETPGPGGPDGYSAAALAADITAVVRATGAMHLLGHSYGGLVTRQAVLTGRAAVGSLTLMSSGPAGLTGPRAAELRGILAALWRSRLEPQAVAAGVPGRIVAFLERRMLSNDPAGLVFMARHLLSAADLTADLARLDRLPVLVLYGQDDNSWSPRAQEDMAVRLGAHRVCIPGAAHSPAVEAPATTASALTRFWDAAEAGILAGAATGPT